MPWRHNCLRHHTSHREAEGAILRSPSIQVLKDDCSFSFHTNMKHGRLLGLKLYVGFPAFTVSHDDVIKWKHFPRYWPFVRGIHRSPVNSPHKGQWRGALMFTLICARINGWVNNGEAGDLRRYRVHYDVTVMNKNIGSTSWWCIRWINHFAQLNMHVTVIKHVVGQPFLPKLFSVVVGKIIS